MRNKTGDLIMTSNKTLVTIAFISLFVVFNFVVFILQIPLTPTFWIAYVFTSISFFLMIFISYKIISSQKSLKSKFLNMSLIQIAYSYFVSQLVIGILLFILTAVGYDQQITLVPIIGFVVSIALLGFTISKLSFTKLGINEVERVEKKVNEKVNFIKEKQLILDQLLSEVNDKDVKKALSSLSETIRFSDPMSNDAVTEIEDVITNKINNMSQNIMKVSSADSIKLCQEVKVLFEQRNKNIKLNK